MNDELLERMMDTVLPCPFCAYQPHPSDHVRCEKVYEIVHYAINCRSCGAVGPNEVSLTEARRMWNLRRVPAAGGTGVPVERIRKLLWDAERYNELHLTMHSVYDNATTRAIETVAEWLDTICSETTNGGARWTCNHSQSGLGSSCS